MPISDPNTTCNVDKQATREVLFNFKTSFDKEQEIHRSTDILVSSSFNIFDYLVDLRSEKGELMLSNVLAMILNSDGEHGQGDVFQKLFFAMVKDQKDRCAAETIAENSGLLSCPNSGYQVKTEESITNFYAEDGTTKQGRIDISLHHPDGWIVGIENKPFALDQARQVERYMDDLEQRADAGYGLIYLSRTGSPPSNHSLLKDKQAHAIAEGKLCVLGYYADLMPYLHSCSQECKSPRFSNFLDDFASYVSSHFPNTRSF